MLRRGIGGIAMDRYDPSQPHRDHLGRKVDKPIHQAALRQAAEEENKVETTGADYGAECEDIDDESDV